MPSVVRDVLAAPGRPLAAAAPGVAHEFADVRIHTDATAAASATAVGADAYTVGDHVVFAAGRFRPDTEGGRGLLAHELTHVRQQAGAGGGALRLAGAAHASLEADAVRAGRDAAAAAGAASPVAGARGLVQRQASSSASSRSSADGGAAATGGSTAAGARCKVDVRATHIGGLLSHAPIWHDFVVYTDGAGTEYYFRGGPGGHCPGVAAGTFGTIHTNSGAYVAGTVDWSPGAPSVTVLSGAGACGKDACLARELTRIEGTCTPYHPTGPNSNTVAKTILDKCGMTPAKPVTIAPGWGDPDL